MTDDQSRASHSDAYRAAREQFDQLRLEERAQFLVEAMLVTIGRGLETAGETISREMDGAISSVRDTVREASDSMRAAAERARRTPGAAEGATPEAPFASDPDTVTPPGAASPGTDWAGSEDATGEAPNAPGA